MVGKKDQIVIGKGRGQVYIPTTPHVCICKSSLCYYYYYYYYYYPPHTTTTTTTTTPPHA